MLFFYNTLEENDVFQAAGAITLYGAAIPRLKTGLTTVVQHIQAAADGFGKSGDSSQDDGDPMIILFYLLNDASYG